MNLNMTITYNGEKTYRRFAVVNWRLENLTALPRRHIR